jgi:polyisoprenoid-binding protein YceI
MTDKRGLEPATREHNAAPRRRRWRRWVVIGAGVLIVLVGLVAVSVKPQPGPPPLALPTERADAPTAGGEVDGTWSIAAGSEAGFRVRQTIFGRSGDIVGRTNAVTGAVSVSRSRLTSATFSVDLTTIKVNDKASPQFEKRLDTRGHPDASFTLGRPITLDPDVNTGGTIAATATGQLTLHGVTGPATLTFSGRRNGSALEAAGSIPITFSDWGIDPPENYGFVGSLADRGMAEFLLVLHRR